MTERPVTASTVLTHAAGLHARPSLKLTMLAKTFAAKIELAISAEGPWIDAKSIVKVMATKAPMGSVLHFRASGEGADIALEAIVGLIDRDFDADRSEAADSARSEVAAAKVPAEDPADG